MINYLRRYVITDVKKRKTKGSRTLKLKKKNADISKSILDRKQQPLFKWLINTLNSFK